MRARIVLIAASLISATFAAAHAVPRATELTKQVEPAKTELAWPATWYVCEFSYKETIGSYGGVAGGGGGSMTRTRKGTFMSVLPCPV